MTVAKDDPDPKALACYGVLLRAADDCSRASDEVWLRYVGGRPISCLTIRFLEWCTARLGAEGKKALLLVWDNAPWHSNREVPAWLRAHNRHVKLRGEGMRIIPGPLSTKSPWLNPIQPKWVHGKSRVFAPACPLTAKELAGRVCAALACVHEDRLVISENVA